MAKCTLAFYCDARPATNGTTSQVLSQARDGLVPLQSTKNTGNHWRAAPGMKLALPQAQKEAYMSTKGFSHIGLSTLDLDTTRRFYEGILKFGVVRYDTITVKEGGQIRHIFFDTGRDQLIAFMEARGVPGVPAWYDAGINRGLGVPSSFNHFAFEAGSEAGLVDSATSSAPWASTSPMWSRPRLGQVHLLPGPQRDPAGVLLPHSRCERGRCQDAVPFRYLDPAPEPGYRRDDARRGH